MIHAALNLTTVEAADISSAYLQAPTSEKQYIFCGNEFGLENVGKQAKFFRALYGVKSAGSNFWNHLCSCMDHLGVESSKANPDLWIRQLVRKDVETEYHEYILLYVDDFLVISDRAESMIRNEIGKYFFLKGESIWRYWPIYWWKYEGSST